jgi:hypothetical protein
VTSILPVLVDRTVHRFTTVPAAVSPNGDGVADELSLAFELTRAASVRIEIAQSGKTLASVYSADLPIGTQTVAWAPPRLKDGKYAAVLTATNDVGVVVHTVFFRIDTVAPTLRVLSFRRLQFGVSEPATISLIVNGRRTTRVVRAGVFSFRPPRVRTVRIVARDAAGNLSRTLKFP